MSVLSEDQVKNLRNLKRQFSTADQARLAATVTGSMNAETDYLLSNWHQVQDEAPLKSKEDDSSALSDFRTVMEKLEAADSSDRKFILIKQNITHLLSFVRTFIDDQGGQAIIRLGDDNTVKMTSVDWLASYVAPKLEERGYHLSAKSLREHIKTFLDLAPRLDKMPASFSLDATELTFNRISLNLEPGDCPTWDYFIKKCGENGEALMAFTWSIFNREDRSQQYLFLKGPGGDGKGSYIRWLNRLLNDQLMGLSAGDKYWPALCVGKRVGVFNEINSTSIVLTSQFKQITGGDKITVTNKFEKAFATTVDTKFILTTNNSISVTGSDADKRRAILVELEPSIEIIPSYEEKLEAETSAYLFKCKQAYERLYDPSRKMITCDYSFFESEAADFEEPNELFLERFVLDTNAYVTAAQFQSALRLMKADNNAIKNFKEWLKRNHGISRQYMTVGGRRQWVYLGLKTKGC